MTITETAQCPTCKTGNLPHLRSIAEGDRFGAAEFPADWGRAVSHFAERLSDSDRRVLGIAALLGAEVSVHEVARVTETLPCEIAVAFARAVTLGIMVERRGDHFSFVHERVQDTAFSSLEPTESLAAHARAARLLTTPTPEHVLRRVHHAFVAANRSTEDAAVAVQIARESAVVLQATERFEQAAVLLGRAVDLCEAAALIEPAATLVVEWAEAILACGRLAEARPLFHRAARLAEAGEDAVVLARAALGLGGVWVREHRLTEEAEHVGALQRRALAALPDDASVLRARLAVRLAAESVYRGGAGDASCRGSRGSPTDRRCTGTRRGTVTLSSRVVDSRAHQAPTRDCQ